MRRWRLVVPDPVSVGVALVLAVLTAGAMFWPGLPWLVALAVLAVVVWVLALAPLAGWWRLERRPRAVEPKMATAGTAVRWVGGAPVLAEVHEAPEDPCDVCQCGDLRRMHVPGACRLCILSSSPYEVCRGFRLWIGAVEWAERWGEVPDRG